MHIFQKYVFLSLLFIAACTPSFLLAQNTDFNSLALEEKQMLDLFYETSSLPTKTDQPISQTPALLTVFTVEEIHHMGARDLKDVLHHVPGLQLGIGAGGYPQITLRGMKSHDAEKVKVLVDGHDVDNPLTGGGALLFLDIPVDYIQKVEVLREPGSTLYGSDALLGVISIVTSRSLDYDRTIASVRFDTFDGQRFNFENSSTFGKIHLWGNINYFNTNGPDVKIDQDALSASPANSAISNAPGYTNEWQERSDFSFGANSGPFRFQCQYITHRDGGFFNPGMSLSDETVNVKDVFWTDLSYELSVLDDKLNIQAKLLYNYYDHDNNSNLQPPGYVNINGIVYPDGIYSFQEASTKEYGAEIQLDGHFFEKHTLTLGSDVKKSRLYDVVHHANYNPSPLPAIIDVSDTYNWMESADRFFYSFYLQDQYRFSDTLQFILGGRYDNYDDIGDSFTTNMAIAWKMQPDLCLKLKYSEAFRAPSFRELYKLPAGSPLEGDSSLEAESSETYQSTLEWHPNQGTTLALTGFITKFKNFISEDYRGSLIKLFVNGGDFDTKGLEFTVNGKVLNADISGSLSYVDSKDNEGDDVAGVAAWLASAMINYPFAEFYNFNMTFSYTGDAEKSDSDTQDGLDDFLLTDLSLTARDGLGHTPGLDIITTVHNLFDVDYAFPDLSRKLAEHFERPGISADVWLRYRF